MNICNLLVASLTAAAVLASATEASAFRGCRDIRDDSTLAGCWPDNVATTRPADSTPGGHGTRRWSFCYKFENEGLELYDVAYGSDPADRHTVAKRISMPYIMTRYPQPDNATNPSPNPTDCGSSSGPAYDDTMIAARTNDIGAEMHCAHVPTTVCELGERRCDLSTNTCFGASMSCGSDEDCIGNPRSALLDESDCTGSCVPCRGVCVGTQVELGGLELGGTNEATAGGGEADVVLTTMNKYGGYQFYQRYRFKHDGRLVSSFRFGGIHDMQWHNHIAYWRFEFDLQGSSAGNDALQRCENAACGSGPSGWSLRNCECSKTNALPIPEGLWRVYDRSTESGGTPTRSLHVMGGPNDGEPTVCQNNDKDYCVLRANHILPNEGLTKQQYECTDGLNGSATQASCGDISQGAPLAFYYLGHHNGHTPCEADEQDFCGPGLGEQAMGPVLQAVGDW
jgi:hypothetical protein